MHPLLTAPSSDLNAQMVKDFVALGIPENLTVEYKRQGDKPIEAVAALANTYGGLLLVGVAEESQGVPGEVVGVDQREKAKLVNQMATMFDPPWTPEVVEVPLDDSDKVVLVIRIDRDSVPAPIVLDGRIPVRLDARNTRAGRSLMAAMLAQASDLHALPRLGHPTRGPMSHRPFVDAGLNTEQPDLILRSVTVFPLHSRTRRSRLATGMPSRITVALQRTGLHPMVQRLALGIGGGETVISPWRVARATSREIVLDLRASAGDREAGRGVLCRVTVEVSDSGLEVCCDLVFWLNDVVLPWRAVHQSFLTLVPAVAGTLLPETVSAVAGAATLAPPVVEIHLSTYRSGHGSEAVENVVDVSAIGDREDLRPFYGAGEVLDESLVEDTDWEPAVADALTAMAMDWGFPTPVFDDQTPHDEGSTATGQGVVHTGFHR